MFKRSITYKNFDDKEVTEDYYFNISKSEIIKLQVSENEGFLETLTRIVETQDKKEIVDRIEQIILAAYGVREGDIFRKSDELRDAFLHHPAYDALFIELSTNENAAAVFVNGVFPKDLVEQANAAAPQDKPTGPPPPPTRL